jgi:drug/metabolite transporter (DMT)-like permease
VSADATRRAHRADTRGLILMVASAACFAAMAPFTRKWLTHLEPQSIVLARAIVMLVVFGIWGRVAGVSLSGRNRFGLILRGFIGYLAISCYVWSTQHLQPGQAVLLQYSHPVFVAALAPLLLREKPGPFHWPLVLAGFGGLSLAIGVAHFGGDAAGGVAKATTDHAWMVGLLGACLSGFAYMTVRRIAATEAPLTIVFWFSLVMLPAALIGTLVPWSPLDALAQWLGAQPAAAAATSADAAAALRHLLPATLAEIVGYICVVAVGLIGQITLTEGLARAGAARAVAVTMAGPLFGLAFDLIFFGQLPTAVALLGTVVVVAALAALGLLKPSLPITEGEAE